MSTATHTWFVVGLGNPGPTYERTPHNVGWLVLDEIAREAGVGFGRARRAQAAAADVHLGAARLVLVKPLTFMNDSGAPTAALMAYYKVDPAQLVVVHDEIDLPFGALRLKLGGGDNGHNGLRSLRRHLGTGDYHRVRIGIDRPPGRMDPAAYVLKPFPAARWKELPPLLADAADAVRCLIEDGLASAQNRYNS